MLLNNEPGCARAKRVLIAAQKCSGARFGNRVCDLSGRRLAAGHVPDTEHVTFAIGDRDHAVRRNLDGACDGVVDDCLNIHVSGYQIPRRLPTKNKLTVEATPRRPPCITRGGGEGAAAATCRSLPFPFFATLNVERSTFNFQYRVDLSLSVERSCSCRASAPLANEIIGNRSGCPKIHSSSFEANSIRPILPISDESRANRILLNVNPFFMKRFIRTQ